MSKRNKFIITKCTVDELKTLNNAQKPWYSEALISQCLAVSDPVQEQAHLVLIHLVNSESISTQRVQTLVKFSQRKHAPPFASCLKFATPTYYRKYEGGEKGVRDEMEGLLKADMRPWIKSEFSSLYGGLGASIEATGTLSYSSEPWVYCTSIRPQSELELKKLERGFSSGREEDIEYDTITEIQDPNAFAIQLGIDFAIILDKSKNIVEDARSIIASAYRNVTRKVWKNSRPIDKVVHVYHGPVIYEDRTDVVNDKEFFSNTPNWPKFCFRKRTSFSEQMEYRFALSTFGKPREDVFFLKVSDELKCVTRLKS